jgi:hypothetical protein
VSAVRHRKVGFLDLLVVCAAVFAVWTRTPVGGLGQWAWGAVRGSDDDRPSLIAFFRSEGPDKAWRDEPVVTVPREALDPYEGDGFPEPWRSAVHYAVPDHLPRHTEALLADLREVEDPDTGIVTERSASEALLIWLDENWTPGADAGALLEQIAVDPALRQRAIARATAAGESDPTSFAAHRRYLPEHVEREAGLLVDSVLSLATVFDLHWPVDPSMRISSPFGYRVHPITRKRKFHNGVDMAVKVGTPLWAAQSGTIVAATENAVSGKYVILEHPGGIRTAYCHLSELPEKGVGDRVERGEVFAKSGNSGRSTGPHLHFILRVDGDPIDPLPFRRVPKS